MLNCRTMIPKYRTVLFNAEEFFSGYKIKFDSPINPVGASIVPLSEVTAEAVTYGHGAA